MSRKYSRKIVEKYGVRMELDSHNLSLTQWDRLPSFGTPLLNWPNGVPNVFTIKSRSFTQVPLCLVTYTRAQCKGHSL